MNERETYIHVDLANRPEQDGVTGIIVVREPGAVLGAREWTGLTVHTLAGELAQLVRDFQPAEIRFDVEASVFSVLGDILRRNYGIGTRLRRVTLRDH